MLKKKKNFLFKKTIKTNSLGLLTFFFLKKKKYFNTRLYYEGLDLCLNHFYLLYNFTVFLKKKSTNLDIKIHFYKITNKKNFTINFIKRRFLKNYMLGWDFAEKKNFFLNLEVFFFKILLN